MKVSTIVAATLVACVALGSSAFADDSTTIAGVNQSTHNGAAVENNGIIGSGNINGGGFHGWYRGSLTVNSGTVSGKGASASVSASGATSVVSVSSIDATKDQHVNLTAPEGYRSVVQYTTNYGAVVNNGFVGVSTVSGDGASVSVSASGATSAVAISSIK